MNCFLLNLGLLPIPPVPGDMPRNPSRSDICRQAARINAAKRMMNKNASKAKVLAAVTANELNCVEAGRAAGIVKGYAYNLLTELINEGLVTRRKGCVGHYYKAVVCQD